MKSKVAIVGMSCLYPGAPDLASFWSNIVGAVDATSEVTEREWDQSKYYDPDGQALGLSYSKRGGFISEYADFDPLKYGVMPSAVAGSDPDQFLTLRVALAAMADAGYGDLKGGKPIDRDRAEIIIGRISAPGAGSMNLIHQSKTVHEIRAILQNVLADQDDQLIESIVQQMKAKLVASTADNIPGAMPNILAGRIANKLGFRGRSLLIDAACASSMVAIETAASDLLDRRCDFALAGGVHINASAVFFQMFCGLGALSHNDTIRPFDQDADGTMLGEGIGIVCLKRYEDALADGDRIYATICGVASSSDGFGGSVLAPSLEGEALAMEKAYSMAGISPASVELLEAHGTGTPVGDVVELQAVEKVFAPGRTQAEPWCAVGSIKSMIGHCQSASAVAGVIKTALALHHKILPPTLNVSKPNTKINWATHPCYINSKTRPWIKSRGGEPRRAAVSAFGFGGVNGHMILEEYEPAAAGVEQQSLMHDWDREVFTFCQPSREALLQAVHELSNYVAAHPQHSLKDLAYSVNCIDAGVEVAHKGAALSASAANQFYRLALVVADQKDLLDKLQRCQESLSAVSARDAGTPQLHSAEKGLYFSTPDGAGAPLGGKLAFLYPGLGSAYTNMLADLCMHFPEVRDVFEIVDDVALSAGADEPPSKLIFPPPFDKGQRAVPTLLAAADFAVVAVLLAEYAMYQLLVHLDITPDVLMGCSTGEFAAITTTGSVDVLSVAKTFYQLSTRVARSIPAESLANLRTVRVLASWEKVSTLTDEIIYLSADLGENHVIVTADVEAIEKLTAKLKEDRIPCQLLPVPIPYHTPLVASIIDANNEAVRAVDIQPLAIPGWSCSTAQMYPHDVEAMRASFVELFTHPIALRKTVQAMYADGVRTFLEVGPNGILSSSMDGILGDKPHLALPSNLASRSGLAQIQHLIAALFVQGRPANLAFLYKRRAPQIIDWTAVAAAPPKRSARKIDTVHTALTIEPGQIARFGHRSGRRLNVDASAGEDEFDFVSDDGAGDDEIDLDRDADDRDSAADAVLQTFLNTNTSFYSKLNAISEEVMRSYIQSSDIGDDSLPEQAQSADDDAYSAEILDRPFLRRARLEYGAENTEMYLNLDLATDLYLLDHAIGGVVSTLRRTRVHLVPLMVTLEIMAEAALAHVQWGMPVRVQQVRAFRRIVVDHQGLMLQAIASGDADKASVILVDAAEPEIVYATAEFVFADLYSDHPNHDRPPQHTADGSAPTNLTRREKLYNSGPLSMFHGPLMQAVLELERVGHRSVSGRALAGSARGWLANAPQDANFLLHPLLLDNASQFVLFLLYEKGLSATALLPFLIEAVDLCQAPDDLEKEVQVTAILPTLSERATEANLEVINQDRLAIKISGINSRRVILSPLWEEFVGDPVRSFLGQSMAINDSLADRGIIMQVTRACLPDDDVILEWCLDYILTRSEQVIWREKSRTKKRKIDWLLGRIAAKEAVRKLVLKHCGVALGPHDVEIIKQAGGAPVAIIGGQTGPNGRHEFAHLKLPAILVSISHTDKIAVAFAVLADSPADGPAGVVPGIDAEVVREYEPSFASTFLKPHELQYLASCPSEKLNTEVTRLWSAKEALFKACNGAVEMSSFALITPNPVPGSDRIVMAGGEPSQATTAYVSTDADLVIAYTLR
ncbi:MAG: polyketide synthase dehydratase domain-containing protein [Cyanobacteria bacterium REEB67]|nr:polyketide synthase dehydratase domain-containing protein [Cyanobacteria bacterium REEB67]